MKHIALVLFGVAVLSCASTDIVVPTLRYRVLEIDLEHPGAFKYQYHVCAKKLLGFCRDWQLVTDRYDLNDIAVRKELNAMNFVLRVRDTGER